MARGDERDLERTEPWWMLAVWAGVYASVGIGIAYVGHRLSGFARVAVTVPGVLLAAAGGWCLLWFVGIAGLAGLAHARHPDLVARAAVFILVAVLLVAEWFVLFR